MRVCRDMNGRFQPNAPEAKPSQGSTAPLQQQYSRNSSGALSIEEMQDMSNLNKATIILDSDSPSSLQTPRKTTSAKVSLSSIQLSAWCLPTVLTDLFPLAILLFVDQIPLANRILSYSLYKYSFHHSYFVVHVSNSQSWLLFEGRCQSMSLFLSTEPHCSGLHACQNVTAIT